MDMKDGKLRGSQVVGTSVNYSPEINASEPNANLLQRLADSGGGKVLDRDLQFINPFSHDRQKTFQPRDLWQWLLKFALILFVADVGIRRIQIDRAEWLRATATLRRWIFFWRGVPRTPQADESLAALLARRDQVRAVRRPPGQPEPVSVAPRADLFQPVSPLSGPLSESEGAPLGSTPQAAPPSPEPEPPPAEAGSSTTSRLLEAKRRAQRRRSPPPS
jgi:hypothetical protein